MNLIICTTPLQTLLAKEIVKNYEDEKFYGILFSNHFSRRWIDILIYLVFYVMF